MNNDISQLGLPIASDTPHDAQEATPVKLAADAYPRWYRPSKTRKTSNLRVLRGIHPRGRALGPDGSRCATCTHLVWSGAGNKIFKKCTWNGIGVTQDSDVIMAWRGCELFELAYPVDVAYSWNDAMSFPWNCDHVERLSLDQWLMVFTDDCKRLSGLPQAVDVRVAIDALLAFGSVPGLEVWHRAQGMVDS